MILSFCALFGFFPYGWGMVHFHHSFLKPSEKKKQKKKQVTVSNSAAMMPQSPLIDSGRYHAVISLVMFLLHCEARPQFDVPRWCCKLGRCPKFRPKVPHWSLCLPISSSQLLGVILRTSCSDMSSVYTCLTSDNSHITHRHFGKDLFSICT